MEMIHRRKARESKSNKTAAKLSVSWKIVQLKQITQNEKEKEKISFINSPKQII